jgi:hypothetical protein
MSDNLEVENLDIDLEEAKATGEDSESTDATTPEGGNPKKRKGDKAGGEKADNVEDDVKTPQGSNDAGLKEAIEGLFEGTELTEDFKVKTVAVFEAAVHEKVLAETAVLEEKFENDLQEQVDIAVEDLVEKVDSYLDYVVESWVESNKVEIESNFKVETAQSLLDNIKGLVAEHNLEIDDSQVDAIAEMETKVEESTTKYNEVVEEMIAVKEAKQQLELSIAFNEVSEGLTDTQSEKLKVLSEGVSFESVDEFTKKVSAIKENYFAESTTAPTDETEFLEEEAVEDGSQAQTEIADPAVSAYADALGRFAAK